MRLGSASSVRRSSHAATCTPCSPPISPTSGTRAGGRTCSSAGTDRRRAVPMMTEPRPSGGAISPLAIGAALPPAVALLLETLWSGGHAAFVVGGSIRDLLLGREPVDWDLATDARPAR